MSDLEYVGKFDGIDYHYDHKNMEYVIVGKGMVIKINNPEIVTELNKMMTRKHVFEIF